MATSAPPKPGSPGAPSNPGRLVTDIIERRNESQKWMRKNLYGEMTEVWQAIKCKTPPVYKKDRAGAETNVEDKSRTNVAMPDLNIIYRRNAARMTAQPYRLRYTGGTDPNVADALSGLAMQQYARSNEAFHDVRLVLATEAFGWGYTKLYQDTLTRMMKFRRAIMKDDQVVYRDRASIMRFQGAADDEIDEAVDEYGADMDDDEIADFMSKSGTEVNLPTEVKQYEGPVVKFIFNGDLFLEPNCRTLDVSSYAIEQYVETDLWLKKMSKLTYEDPETGEPVNAFDPDALQELMDSGGDAAIHSEESGDDLRDMFNSAIGHEREQEYQLPFNLRPRKKFRILEQHSQDSGDGKMWITYVSEKWRDRPLGRRPYPYDLYGKYLYTDMTPLPDLISCYGDSTPRLLRHLYSMHNLTVAQNFDYITNLLKPFILSRIGTTIEPEVVVRGLFRELKISDLNGVKALTEPPLPNGAFEREAQILRMMSIAEPSLTAVESGTDTNPQAGKTATTALLSSKAADALTQFKFDGRNRYLRELGLKKLWMNQQQARDSTFEIASSFWNQGTRERVDALPRGKQEKMPDWALSDHYDKVVAIKLDPMEIQEDFECEPEAGSYLAVDDEMRQQAALTLTQVAMANPDVIDRRKVIRFQMSTIRGIGNPDDYFLPPAPQTPPPPKISVNINIPMDKEPGDIVNQLLPLIGLQPSDTLTHLDAIKLAVGAGQAGDAADNLLGPGEQEKQEHETGAAHALEITKQLHDSQQQEGQQEHDHVSAIRDHIAGLHGQAVTHAQNLVEAAQDHQHMMAQQGQQQDAQAEQAAQQREAQAQMQKAQLASQEKQNQAGLDAAGVKQPGVRGMGKKNGQ